jgi:hypothetical protein
LTVREKISYIADAASILGQAAMLNQAEFTITEELKPQRHKEHKDSLCLSGFE